MFKERGKKEIRIITVMISKEIETGNEMTLNAPLS